MNKFNYLVGFGLKKRIARKAFVIANIVIFIILALIINIPKLISLFNKGDDLAENITIDLYNNTSQADLDEKIGEMLNKQFDGYEYFLIELKDDEFDQEVFFKESESVATIIVDGTISAPIFDIYTDDIGLFANISQNLELVIINYQIPDYEPPVINIKVSEDYESEEEEMILSSMLSLLILPMFVLVVTATQFIGVDIIEEKSTKAIETIISSVPANTHFLSKITSSVLFVAIQGVLVLIYGFLANLIGKAIPTSGQGIMPGGSDAGFLEFIQEAVPNFQVVLVVSLLAVIIGTVIFSTIAALFAAMAVTQEDYQQFQTPLMLTLLASFYVAIFAPMAGGTTVMKVLSYIPIFSPMLMPITFASGLINIYEALIILVIMGAFLVLLIYVFTPVYRVAILSYDQTKFFKRIGSYFKKGFQNKKKKK